jgi:hypothetical protein
MNSLQSSLQFAENTTFVFLCCVNTGIMCKQSRVLGSVEASFIIDPRILAQGRNLEEFLPLFLGIENSPSTKTFNFLLVRKESISSMRLIENLNSENC